MVVIAATLVFFAFTSWVDGAVMLDDERLEATGCAGFSGGAQIELEGSEPHRLTVARRPDATVRVAFDGLDVDSCIDADIRAEGEAPGPRTTPRRTVTAGSVRVDCQHRGRTLRGAVELTWCRSQ